MDPFRPLPANPAGLPGHLAVPARVWFCSREQKFATKEKLVSLGDLGTILERRRFTATFRKGFPGVARFSCLACLLFPGFLSFCSESDTAPDSLSGCPTHCCRRLHRRIRCRITAAVPAGGMPRVELQLWRTYGPNGDCFSILWAATPALHFPPTLTLHPHPPTFVLGFRTVWALCYTPLPPSPLHKLTTSVEKNGSMDFADILQFIISWTRLSKVSV